MLYISFCSADVTTGAHAVAKRQQEMSLKSCTFLTGPRVFLSRSPTSSSNRARVSGSLKSTPSAKLSISTRTCEPQIPLEHVQ